MLCYFKRLDKHGDCTSPLASLTGICVSKMEYFCLNSEDKAFLHSFVEPEPRDSQICLTFSSFRRMSLNSSQGLMFMKLIRGMVGIRQRRSWISLMCLWISSLVSNEQNKISEKGHCKQSRPQSQEASTEKVGRVPGEWLLVRSLLVMNLSCLGKERWVTHCAAQPKSYR